MNLVITIDGTDKTNRINWQRFRLTDIIDDLVNTCTFTIQRKEAEVLPALDDEVIITDDGTRIFAGKIIDITKTVKSVDIAVEKYTDETVEDIIKDLIDKYKPEIDHTNVVCDIEVETFTVNNLNLLEAIQKLADATNYRWYVDYDKKLHFFDKDSRSAPFDLTDTNGNYIFKSLVLKDDSSQLINSVKIRGGEREGESRTEIIEADGDNDTYKLSNKFASEPTVTVDSAATTVAVRISILEKSFLYFTCL